MMYSDASVSQDHPTDTTMTALYRQLDDHELGDDASFDVNAGLRHLLTCIEHEVTSPEQAVITSSAPRPRFLPRRPQIAGARHGRRRSMGLYPAVAVAILAILAIGRAIFLPGATAPNPVHPFPRAVSTTPSIAVWPLRLRPGQSQMSAADMKGLATEIGMIRETPTTRLRVIGYASGPGTSAALAFRRAENVAGFLEKQGISASMIEVEVLVVGGVSPLLGTNSADAVVVTWSTLPSPSNSTSPSTAQPTTSASPTPATSTTPTSTPTPTPTPATSTTPTSTPTPATTPTPTPTPTPTTAVSTPPAQTPTPAPTTTTAPTTATSPN
jgi:hypothetical protein